MKMSECLQQAVELKLLRALDAQFAMMIADDEQPAVMLAAALVSHDAGEGHVCLPLSRLGAEHWFAGRHPDVAKMLFTVAGSVENWKNTLLASAAVSQHEEATPLKLIGERLYLNRMWQNERSVAQFFAAQNRAMPLDEQQLGTVLNHLFEKTDETDWQKWLLQSH